MTHLYIELNNIPEVVTSNVIHKLYETAKAIIDAEEANEVEESLVSLKGNLLVDIAYDDEVQWLIDKFGPELSINVTLGRAIKFEDPNMLAYLNNLGIGSNGYITKPDAAAATVVANSGNSTVTKFNELKYFTGITGSNGGLNSNLTGVIKFKGWSALQEIDISNFTSIGHNTSSGLEDTFMECSSLKTVKASSKLTTIGHSAFRLCSNLENITGLSGTIELYGGYQFYGDSKLLSDSFLNVLIKFAGTSSYHVGDFQSCGLLTSIALDPTTTFVGNDCFRDCSSLATITGTSNVTNIGDRAFLLANIASIDLPNTTTIGQLAFKSCTALTTINLSSITEVGSLAFQGCSALTTVTTGSSNFTIGGNAFASCGELTTMNLSHCTSIGSYAFIHDRKLVTSDLSSCTSVGESAFLNCSSLTSLDLSSCTTIGSNAFNGCILLTSVDLSNCSSLPGYPGNAFSNCTSLTTVTGLSNIPDMGYGTFRGCTNLGTNLDLVLNITTNGLSGNTFRGTKFKTVTINGSNLTNIFDVTGGDVYPGVCFMNSCIKMDFSNTKITSVGGLTGCSSIDTVIYPSTITNIHWNFATGNSNATYIVLLAITPPSIEGELTHFSFANSDCHIYVPDSSLSTYLTTDKWSGDKLLNRLKSISELPTSVTWVTKQSS